MTFREQMERIKNDSLIGVHLQHGSCSENRAETVKYVCHINLMSRPNFYWTLFSVALSHMWYICSCETCSVLLETLLWLRYISQQGANPPQWPNAVNTGGQCNRHILQIQKKYAKPDTQSIKQI